MGYRAYQKLKKKKLSMQEWTNLLLGWKEKWMTPSALLTFPMEQLMVPVLLERNALTCFTWDIASSTWSPSTTVPE